MGRSDRQDDNNKYLWTQEQYGDFVLDLEVKTTPGTNSGIFVRTSNLEDPVQTGIEVQVTHPAPGRRSSKNSVGALYDLVPAKSTPLEPDD